MAVNTARMKYVGTLGISMDDTEKQLMQAGRLRSYRLAAGFKSASEAARVNRWTGSTYISHENGTRKIGDDDADRYAAGLSRPGRKISGQDIIYGPSEVRTSPAETGIILVPVVGMIGAGATIEPEYEQIPPDGLYQVELPIPVPEGIIAFQVEGDSMMPRYDAGDVILVWSEQRRAIESFYGEEVAVRTSDGRRFLKVIQYGKNRSVVNLQSFNAKMIEGVQLEWVGEIYSTIRAGQIHRMAKRGAAKNKTKAGKLDPRRAR